MEKSSGLLGRAAMLRLAVVCVAMATFHLTARAQSTNPAPQEGASPPELKLVRLLGDPSFRHDGEITDILPLPDGKRVLTSSRDGTVRLWGSTTGKELRRYVRGRDQVPARMSLLPVGKEFVAAYGDGSIIRWSVGDGTVSQTYARPDARTATDLAISPDGKYLGVGEGETCVLWELATGKEVWTFNIRSSGVRFCAGGKWVVTGTDNGSLLFLDAATGKNVK